VSWRGSIRRFLPYVIAIIGGFILAYLIVAFVIFPSGIVPKDVRVPNVVGLDFDEAVRRLQQAGFTADRGEMRFHTSAPKMTVLEQTPAAGASDLVGSAVTLALSNGQRIATIPNVTGMSQSDAERQLEAAGFDAGDVTEQPSQQARGEVIGTRPQAGSQLPIPSTVALVISAGPTVVIAPDVVGRNFAQARSLLEQVGLALGQVMPTGGAAADGSAIVTSQTPAAGSQVARGAKIGLQVGPPR
jgi:eukaryotic-like serine/threonine-protein kinase